MHRQYCYTGLRPEIYRLENWLRRRFPLSILTKIFIVLQLVLVLLACPVFIAQATTQPNYRDAYEREYARAAAAGQQARNANFAAERAKALRDQDLREAAADRSNDKGKIDNLQEKLSGEEQKNINLDADLTKIRSDLGNLKTHLNGVEDRRKELSTQLAELHKTNTDINKEYRKLDETLKVKSAEAERLEKVAKVLREELTDQRETIQELAETIRKLKESGGKLTKKPGEVVEPAPDMDIEGAVTAVKGDVASINIGKAKGVKSGMKLIIFRNAQFVANIRIAEVDTNEAVGIVIDRQRDPIPGDKVMSKK